MPAIKDEVQKPVAALQDGDPVFNGSYVQKKQKAIKTIVDHPVFDNIDQAEALAIDGTAELSAFSCILKLCAVCILRCLECFSCLVFSSCD